MDSDTPHIPLGHPTSEPCAESFVDSAESSSSSSFAGAFFPHSTNLNIHGGTYASNVHVHQAAKPELESFRRIRRGDIDLRITRETRLSRDAQSGGITSRFRAGNTVQRRYSARIRGEDADFSVLLYEGKDAAEEWREYVSQLSCVWHPNVVQIFAVANYADMYAVVAYDDLLPYEEFLSLRNASPVAIVYYHACWAEDFIAAESQVEVHAAEGTSHWIRSSSGRLCIDLVPSEFDGPPLRKRYTTDMDIDWHGHNRRLIHQSMDQTAIESFTMHEFHCFSQRAFRQRRFGTWPATGELTINAVYLSRLEIARLGATSCDWYVTEGWRVAFIAVHSTLTNGWTRFKVRDMSDENIRLATDTSTLDPGLWLSQANHIMKCSHLGRDSHHLRIVQRIQFHVSISPPTVEDLPQGYLFLCPMEWFKVGSASFRFPLVTPWFYWSLDPTGDEILSPEQALSLGFPSLETSIACSTTHWEARAYDALRTFHEGKGFDPDSQDVAIHLGYPLYHLWGNTETSGEVALRHGTQYHSLFLCWH
ncbi:hypothetical protein FB45DRAFT_927044 [Roridomyces roridus]|uniref:Protein kinase domain-containing protein n=1 Tax=Roridomyces roridus TaxID=1738132 RepID=A0AAD7FJ77_9AGAR|nr:hypothetical protein FB45DRAFT_927044 [Roridomyces roridus]